MPINSKSIQYYFRQFLVLTMMLFLGCDEQPLEPQVLGGLSFEPLVKIVSPENEASFIAGDTIYFMGNSQDVEDSYDLLTCQWFSSKDGLIETVQADSNGNIPLATDRLTYNQHSISLVITDTDGNVARDSVLIYNNLPRSVFLNPIQRSQNAAQLSWTKSLSPDFAYYKIVRSTAAGAGLGGTQIAIIESMDSTSYIDSDIALGIKYFYQIFVYNNDLLTSGSNEQNIEVSNISIRFNFEPTDVVMHPTLPYVYISDKENHGLYFVNLETGEVQDSIFFDYMTESLEVFDTGQGVELYVALLYQNHSSFWWEEDQQGFVAVLNADQFQLIDIYSLNFDPYDIAVDRSGYIYIPCGSAQWTEIRSYTRPDFTQIGMSRIRQESEIKMHPTFNKIYAMNTDTSPRDMEAFSVNNGTISGGVDSPYHGTYSFGHPFVISPAGDYLVTASGTIFSCTNSTSDNLTYLANLGSGFRDACFDLDNSLLYTASLSNSLNIYNSSNYAPIGDINTEGNIQFMFYRESLIVGIVTPVDGDANYLAGVELINP